MVVKKNVMVITSTIKKGLKSQRLGVKKMDGQLVRILAFYKSFGCNITKRLKSKRVFLCSVH